MRLTFWTLLSLFAALLAPRGAWEASVSQNFAITVTAATQTVGFSPTSLTFASQNTGTSSAAQITTMTNTGNVPFPLSSVATTGANTGDFSETNNCPTPLAVGASCHINVVFTPTAAGTRTASVVVSATGGGTYTVPLSGTGADPSIVPAFYVATNGSDSNPGTVASPFATVARCQTAMRSSSTVKTCYIRAGTYDIIGGAGAGCFESGSGSSNNAILMTTADNGETLSYYPPDGPGTAYFNGTGGVEVGICLTGSNITVNGLQVGNYSRFEIGSTGPNNIIQNNTVHDFTLVNSNASIFLHGNSSGTVVHNNYVYNSANNGISAQPGSSGQITGVVIHSNFLLNSSSNCTDCGAIYTQDTFASSTGIAISNNYVRDVAFSVAGQNSKGIYLDDGSSNHTVSGNIVEPGSHGWACFQIHGGKNNTLLGNICDEGPNGTPGGVVFYQTTGLVSTGMSGNSFTNNIVVGGMSGSGGGYNGTGAPPAPMTINNNAYHNYVGSSINASGSGGAGNDFNPTSENPQISCWALQIAPGSPVFNSPVNFSHIAGGWGPPGFAIPQFGTPPSSPHGC